MPKRALCWLRRDLRLFDHAPLAAATETAEEVAVAFVFDRNILEALEDRDDKRLTFIHRSLAEVDAKLRERGSRLIALHGDPIEEIPKLAKELKADAVFTGRDYEPYAAKRDAEVDAALHASGSALHLVKDEVIFEAGEVLGNQGQVLRVYGPYARQWRKRFRASEDAAEHQPNEKHLMPASSLKAPELQPLAEYGFVESDLWLEAGEDAGRRRLRDFAEKLGAYPVARNFPSQEGTSGLGVHLRFGTVSVRECVRFALEQSGEAADKWLAETIWRDFFQAILVHFPYVVELPFKEQYGRIRYPGMDAHFEAWCRGETGYPIVDAAMRCLNQTGFMNNRLRIVVASFLCKDLLVDYRKGEAYFARRLLDFELASNNGNWQWAASTGSDAQPYFRIYNPVLQSEKYDPDGSFIRTYVPELASVQGRGIHFPAAMGAVEREAAGVRLGETYPSPIVNHGEQVAKAKDLLRSARV